MGDEEIKSSADGAAQTGPVLERGDYTFVLAIFETGEDFMDFRSERWHRKGLLVRVTEAGSDKKEFYGVGGFNDDLPALVELLGKREHNKRKYNLRDNDCVRFTGDTSRRSNEVDFGYEPVKISYIAAPLCGWEAVKFLKKFVELMPKYKGRS